MSAIALTKMQVEILRAIEMHGGITPEMTDRNGWTRRGLPCEDFNQLIREYRIVAPKVLTSYPLRIVWQLRELKTDRATLEKIDKEARRLGFKEYAKDDWGKLPPGVKLIKKN